jgi:hypothetical protein
LPAVTNPVTNLPPERPCATLQTLQTLQTQRTGGERIA